MEVTMTWNDFINSDFSETKALFFLEESCGQTRGQITRIESNKSFYTFHLTKPEIEIGTGWQPVEPISPPINSIINPVPTYDPGKKTFTFHLPYLGQGCIQIVN